MRNKEKYFYEKNKIQIKDEYDVIVVGGGIAGVSAALAASRNRVHTLLIEKSVMLGGLATLGNIAIYLPLCDGLGNKIIGGIAEELLHLSIKYGYNNLPEKWKDGKEDRNKNRRKKRYRTVFSPGCFAIALDEIIEKEGIDLLFDTLFSKPVMKEKRCSGIIVENKSGRTGFTAKVIIDTTGDADVMARAGVETTVSDNWLSYWSYMTSIKDMNNAVKNSDLKQGIILKKSGADNTGKGCPDSSKKYLGNDMNEVTDFIVDGRKIVKKILKNNKNTEIVVSLPGMAQFRTTRNIKGCYELNDEDVFKKFNDSIGCAGDWRKRGPIYEIPYRSLIVEDSDNLLTAGRSIAATGDALEVTRVIPVAALTGQAAGTAAAIAVSKNCSVQDVPVPLLQEKLKKTGILLHYKEVLNK